MMKWTGEEASSLCGYIVAFAARGTAPPIMILCDEHGKGHTTYACDGLPVSAAAQLINAAKKRAHIIIHSDWRIEVSETNTMKKDAAGNLKTTLDAGALSVAGAASFTRAAVAAGDTGPTLETDEQFRERMAILYENQKHNAPPSGSTVWNAKGAILDTLAEQLGTKRQCADAEGRRSVVGEYLSRADARRHLHSLIVDLYNQESPMPTPSLPQRALTTLKTDGADAAYRVAGKQLVKAVREPLIAAISRHLNPDDDSVRAKVASFLDTDIGAAVLGGLLSMALSTLPTGGEKVERLARELRVGAMTEVGDQVAGLLTGPLLNVVSLYLQDPGGGEAMLDTAKTYAEIPERTPTGGGIGVRERVAQ